MKLLFIFICLGLPLVACDSSPKTVDACGDGVLDPAEECDTTVGELTCASLGHYNTTGTLRCNADCTLDRDDCGGRCGDSTVDADDDEECDGASLNGYLCETLGFSGGALACDADCRFDTTGCLNSCGNGLRETGELCDDGNPDGGDGCSSTCEPETGWTCDEASPSVCTADCGDGLAVGEEPCDGDDLGARTCVTEGYYGGDLACTDACTLDLAGCAAAGRCGDGTAQTASGEDCDGTDLAGGTCTDLGYYGGDLGCDSGCDFLLTGCEAVGRCGDGTLQAAFGEACDGSALGTSSCLSLGYYGGTIACDAGCGYDLASCVAAGRCGDGLIQSGASELCDGSNFGAHTCTTREGLAYGALTCAGDCRAIGTAGCYGRRYLSVGGTYGSTCAIDVTDKAWCWGHGSVGTLGNGTNVTATVPSPTSGNYSFSRIPEGGDAHFCGLTTSGAIRCWGLNDVGQLGDGTTGSHNVPTLVNSVNAYTDLASGFYHNCAITTGSVIHCWGLNDRGQLGNNSTTNRSSPYSISGTWVKVAAGGYHTCAIDTANVTKCWGENTSGQVGNGTTTNALAPATVSGSHVFTKIYASADNSCGIKSDGSAYCWGEGGSGQLGRGSATDSSVPVAVSGGLAFSTMAMYSSHLCGITTSGQLHCWGSNSNGQLGLGDTTNRNLPTRVTPSKTYLSVGTGSLHTCAVESAGGLWCWGENGNSQLGNGTAVDSNVPVLTSDP